MRTLYRMDKCGQFIITINAGNMVNKNIKTLFYSIKDLLK